jgi:mRNA interferase MazF
MVDKITTVPKTRVGARLGRLDDEDILRLNQSVLVFLGLAVSPKVQQGA